MIGWATLVWLILPALRAERAHAQDDVTWLLNQINALRASQGLHTYALNPQLTAAAQAHSQYMSDTCDVSHYQSNGSGPIDRARAQGYT
ncbi:MAG: CAP domain-containing protein, partial [Chloroflexi bacterium]|nr:CAP domain-containing protein [Chloroflexota bacterium]